MSEEEWFEGAGYVAVFIASLLLGSKAVGASKTGKAAKVAEVGEEVAEAAEVSEEVAEAAEAGEKVAEVAGKLEEAEKAVEVAEEAGKAGEEVAEVGEKVAEEAVGAAEADKVVDANRLKEYYKQAEKYGTGSIKELDNGRFRFYEKIKPARVKGEMAGARHVREWDPYSGLKRDWYETIDHKGNIRQVRPDPRITGGVKVHYTFDAEGKYTGNWIP